jgi:hypothetical protein
MKIVSNSFLVRLAATLITLTVFSGCCIIPPQTKAYNIKLSLDESLKGSTVQVDLIGFNEGNLPRYKTYSVSDYFGDPNDRMRKLSQKKQFVFGQGQPLEQMMFDTDSLWYTWLNKEKASYLLVLVDLPGIFDDQEAQTDPRRLIIPLKKCAWQGSLYRNVKTIDVIISEINTYSLQNFKDKNL